MKIKVVRNNFLDLSSDFSDWQNSKVVIILFGLENSTSYGQGTKNGPRAIVEASHEVELFDEEFQKEIYKDFGITTLKEFSLVKNVNQSLENLEKIVQEVIAAKKFPIILGGEHTLTRAPVNFFKDQYKSLTILQFDAHADLRDTIKRNKYSHGAVMRRCLELSENVNLVQLGIRSISNNSDDGSEFDFWRINQDRIKTFWAKDAKNWSLEQIIASCSEKVYLSFDVDVFDPSIMPSTGTPEPGGLSWYQILEILKSVSQQRTIVGADFVELAPIKNLHAPDFMIAKLIYKFISYLK